MGHKFLLDENIPRSIANFLRGLGYDAISIHEGFRGIDDEEIIAKSRREERIVVTFDKDFGFFVFSRSLRPFCVIFLRLRSHALQTIKNCLEQLLQLIENKHLMLENQFLTFNGISLRKRPIA